MNTNSLYNKLIVSVFLLVFVVLFLFVILAQSSMMSQTHVFITSLFSH
jgi:hypothetical protein